MATWFDHSLAQIPEYLGGQGTLVLSLHKHASIVLYYIALHGPGNICICSDESFGDPV